MQNFSGRPQVKSCLVDTGIICALFDRSDRRHQPAPAFANGNRGRLLVAACAVPEAACLVNKFLGPRAATLIAQYEKLNIGFVDAASVAVCERLKIADVATTDRRHFSVIQPTHRRRFNLLPAD